MKLPRTSTPVASPSIRTIAPLSPWLEHIALDSTDDPFALLRSTAYVVPGPGWSLPRIDGLLPHGSSQRPCASRLRQLFCNATFAPTARTLIDSTLPVPASMWHFEVTSASP